MDLVTDLVRTWGPSGISTLIMWAMLKKSEEREAKKDTRIQLLENKVLESYDERILATNQISEAMHTNAVALTALTNEIRAGR